MEPRSASGSGSKMRAGAPERTSVIVPKTASKIARIQKINFRFALFLSVEIMAFIMPHLRRGVQTRIALRLDYGAAVFGCAALIASLAVPASALDVKSDSVDVLNQVSDSLGEEKYDLLGQAENIDVSDISADNKVLFQDEVSAVTVPTSPGGPVQISAEGGRIY